MIGREPRIETKAIIAAVLAAAPYEHHHVRCYTYRELAEQVYGNGDALYEPTAAQLSAVRRAVARLVAEGRAERDGRAWTSEDPLFAPTHIRRLKKTDGPSTCSATPGAC